MEGTGVELSGLEGHRGDWSGMKGTGVDLSGLETWTRGDWIGGVWTRLEETGVDLRGIKGTSTFQRHLASFNSFPGDMIQWSAFLLIQCQEISYS